MGKKSKVKIKGFGKVALKEDLLKPVKQVLQANRDDFTKKDWGYLKDGITGFAKDGKIGSKEQAEISQMLAMSSGQSGFSNSEGWLARGAITNQLSQIRYDDFLGSQQSQNDKFLSQQKSALGSIQGHQESQINSQLGAISSQANSSLAAYQSMLNTALAQGAAINASQRAEFERQNAASESAIKQFQSRIATLPGYDKVAKISTDFTKAVGMEAFEKLGRQMNPIKLKRDPTITGFSQQQQASTQRQQQGIQGFRSRQVA